MRRLSPLTAQRIPYEPQPAPKSGKRCKVDFQLLHCADRAPVPLLFASHGSRSASIHCSLAAPPRPTCPAVPSWLASNASLSVSPQRAGHNGGSQFPPLSEPPDPSTISSIARQARSTKRMRERIRTIHIPSGIGEFSDAEFGTGV